MKKILLIILFFIFSVFLTSDSINLVEIQKKEKKRREGIKKSKYVLTNDKLIQFSLKKGKTYVKTDVDTSTAAETVKSEKKKSNLKNTEQYWRSRLNVFDKNIGDLRKRISQAQSALNRESSNFLIASIPSLQQRIRTNIDKLSNQLNDLKENLKKMEEKKELFFREARMEGALPGWLR
ncbi:MAG: hypothetical protein ABFR75_14620 [Acidobacteriota bacterium]